MQPKLAFFEAKLLLGTVSGPLGLVCFQAPFNRVGATVLYGSPLAMSVPFNGVDMVFLHKIHSTVLQALLPVDGEGELSRDRRLHALFNDLTCRIDLEVRRTSPHPSVALIHLSFYTI